MRVETNDKEVKLIFSKEIIEIEEIQSIIDYIKFREINSKSKATQMQANELADEINQEWWEKNKSKFENEPHS
jgi:hypothetical protein